MNMRRFDTPSAGRERAREQLEQVAAAAPAPADTQKDEGGKVQTRGATALLNVSVDKLPIVGQKKLISSRIRIRPGMERAQAEYEDSEFRELLESIREGGVNTSPIDVRLLVGEPGVDAELLAGTRRLRACQELGIDIFATLRECDDRMADYIHETENRSRKAKSPYSKALQFQAQMGSGLYASATDLAGNIKVRVQEISEGLRLITEAPPGMWQKVSNAGTLKTTQVRPLMGAYKVPKFIKSLEAVEKLTVVELLALAGDAMRRTTGAAPDTTVASVAKRGKAFYLLLPDGVTEAQAKVFADLINASKQKA